MTGNQLDSRRASVGVWSGLGCVQLWDCIRVTGSSCQRSLLRVLPPRFHSSLISRQIPSGTTSPDTASTAAYHTFHPNGSQHVSPRVSLRAWIRGSSHRRSRSPRAIFLTMSRPHPQAHPNPRRTRSRIPLLRALLSLLPFLSGPDLAFQYIQLQALTSSPFSHG